MNVILLSPSGAFASALESLGLDDAEDRITVVYAVTNDASADSYAEAIRLGPAALPPRGSFMATLNRSALGRNLKRILPLDGGRRFATRARKDRRFRTAAADADLIVALERDAVLAAWTGLHRWALRPSRGVFGLAPARALLEGMRNASRPVG